MFGLPVQGIDLPHLERSQKCPKTTPVKPNNQSEVDPEIRTGS